MRGCPYPCRVRARWTERATGPVGRRAHVLGALGALLALASVVIGVQGRVLLHQCVVAEGPLAALGLRMAVLRSASECPDGTLGLGAASHGAVLLLSVAVPVVAAHLLLAACGLGLGVAARRAAGVVRELLASRLVPAAAAPVPVLTARPAAPTSLVAVLVRHDRGHDPARPRRGPPR